MASARKKLDEKNIKILRELVSLAENKYCFDCHQRGPTYVNVTIGSFVCTSCSGLLRGLTPPHRVKSISMATFSPEEIEQLKTQGNEYCRKVWMGLYDNEASLVASKDEQQIKEIMISKYERKRYYLKPDGNDKPVVNGISKPSTPMTQPKMPSSITFPTIPSYNCVTNNCNNNKNNIANFSPPDSFTNNKEINISATDSFNSVKFNSDEPNSQATAANFANFDNNPIFNSANSGAVLGENCLPPPPPSEDRYAALKDLDCLMKSQLMSSSSACSNNENHTNAVSANKNDWSDTNLVWPSSSAFEQSPTEKEELSAEKTSNPFARSENGWNNSFAGNPFKTENIWPSNNGYTNGIPTSQSMSFISSRPVWNTSSQVRNPFFVSNIGQNTTHHSSNPFL